MRNRLIKTDRSVIPALDAPTFGENLEVVRSTRGVSRIGGFKVGFGLSLYGLAGMVAGVRGEYGDDTIVIYDQQKAGTDIPETGALFAKIVKQARCDAAILFPLSGPATQRDWTKYCQDAGLRVIIGLAMTHDKFFVSEGGYIADDAPARAFRQACQQGVEDFVVPGKKIAWVKTLRDVLIEELGDGNFDLYAPGFVTQGGDISECGKVAGPYFHAIVGRDIYEQPNLEAMRMAAVRSTSKLAA